MFDMKKQLMWSKLKVGIVITLALITLFMTVFFAGGIENILSPKAELKAQLQDVKGLRKGAPVWLSGIEIGRVKEIELNPRYGTVISISIKKDALLYINKDSRISVLTMGLLGDKYVELSSGSPQSGPISPGDMIAGSAQIELKDVMDIGITSIQKMSDFIKKLERLVTKVEEGEGTVSKFLTDPSVYDNLKETTRTLSLMAKDMKNSQGTLKMLMEDPELYTKMSAAASSVEEFSRKLSGSTGTIMKLIEDPSLYNRMASASSSLEEFSRKLNEGQGTLRRLAEDAELYDSINKAAGQLSTILERIDRGEGIAGSLVRDTELSRELKETVSDLRELTRDIKEHPKKYFKFSVF
jgi:phospholipid/cholesterol/gamma-HCH transport system substrate-binding protein